MQLTVDFLGILKATQEYHSSKPYTRGVMRYVGSQGRSTANEKPSSDPTLRLSKSPVLSTKSEPIGF
jgi:hypothetical protein